MFTKDEIRSQLNNIKSHRGKPVIVHASMRAIGQVEGGALTLLDALIERFTANDGLLIIPTHTWANFEDKKPIILDYMENKTCTGILCDIALNDKRGFRSYNPTHSVVAFGCGAEQFVKADDNVLTPCAPNGCYGQIIDQDGYVLLIGVGQEKNTLLHCVEEILRLPNRLSIKPIKMAIKSKESNIFYRNFHYLTEQIGDTSLYFPKYEKAFRHYGAITDAVIGDAPVQMCSAKVMKDVATLIYNRSNAQELFADDKPINENFYK